MTQSDPRDELDPKSNLFDSDVDIVSGAIEDEASQQRSPQPGKLLRRGAEAVAASLRPSSGNVEGAFILVEVILVIAAVCIFLAAQL